MKSGRFFWVIISNFDEFTLLLKFIMDYMYKKISIYKIRIPKKPQVHFQFSLQYTGKVLLKVET